MAAAGSLTTETLQALYDFNTVIMTAARVPQIWSNYKVGGKPATKGLLEPASQHRVWLQAKSTGQLSIFVFVMNFGGCLARIFTSIQEGGGIAMVRAYVIGTFANTFQKKFSSVPPVAFQILSASWPRMLMALLFCRCCAQLHLDGSDPVSIAYSCSVLRAVTVSLSTQCLSAC